MKKSDFDVDVQVLQDLATGVSVDSIFQDIQKAVQEGYNHAHYYLATELTDQVGSPTSPLTLLYKIVQMPSFTYRPGQAANRFLLHLASSSYWLDQELFDERLFQKKTLNSLNGDQQAHKELLDIGSTLIDKGFPLSDLKIEMAAENPMINWIKAYVRQCVRWNKRPHQVLQPRYPLPPVSDKVPIQTRI